MTPRPPLSLSEPEWLIVRDILLRQVPNREIWAFGSRARGTPKPYSDLDLVVLGTEPLSLATTAALSEAFSESDLPWKVDVVDWMLTDPAFRRIIERDRVVIQLARGQPAPASARCSAKD